MNLPKNERTFQFEAIGEMTEQPYNGQFTVKCILNIAERRQLEIEKTRIQADSINPTEELRSLANLLATLRVHIIDAPEWWKQSSGGFTIMDANVTVALYYKVLEQESLWREELQSKKAQPGN